MLVLKRSEDVQESSRSWNFTTNFERSKLSSKRNRLDSFNSGKILKRICYLSSPPCLLIPLLSAMNVFRAWTRVEQKWIAEIRLLGLLPSFLSFPNFPMPKEKIRFTRFLQAWMEGRLTFVRHPGNYFIFADPHRAPRESWTTFFGTNFILSTLDAVPRH